MSGRLWIDAYPEHARAVCVDGKGWLVASVELPMQGLSRPRRFRQVVKAVRGLVERLPEEFKETAQRQGFELRGVQPFLGFRKELETQTGFPIRVTESGGCDHDRTELRQLQARLEQMNHDLAQPIKNEVHRQRLKDVRAELEAHIRHLEKRLKGQRR